MDSTRTNKVHRDLEIVRMDKHIQDPNNKKFALCGMPLLEVSEWSGSHCPINTSCKKCAEAYQKNPQVTTPEGS